MTDVASRRAAPTTTPRALRRARLTRQMDSACQRRLTLVCAPPGTGKTTLVADWMVSRPELATAWLDLDHAANDPNTFDDSLTRSFRQLGLTSEGQTISSGSLAQTLGRAHGGPDVVIVLDDAQELTDRSVWHDLTRLAAASPSWLHWVIVTRVDPPLGIRRLQLQGDLAQVRIADLAFDVEETAALMHWFGLDLPSDAVRRLARWSEGWAAALCLAARTMQAENIDGRPWERLGESESVVLDFLVEEVLDHLTPADRRFLLRSSAADLLTPELAAQLTGNDHAGERLHRLERAGTFLLEVDPSGSRYRFHGLMAALLRARLNDEMPAEAQTLARTAAHWYSEHGYVDEAERHAIRAQDWTLVGQLRAARCAEHLIQTGSLVSGLANLPSNIPSHDRVMQTLAMVDAMRRHDRRTVESVRMDDPSALDDDWSTGSVELLNRLMSIERARWLPGAGERWQLTSAAQLAECLDDPFARGTLSAYVAVREGESLVVEGRNPAARRAFDEVVQMSEASAWAYREAEAIVAVMDAANGDPCRASTLSRTEPGPNDHGVPTEATMWRHLATGIAHGLRGETGGLRRRSEAMTCTHDISRSWLLEQCTRMLIGVSTWRAPSVAPILEPPPPGLPTSVAIALGIVETIDRQGRSCSFGGPLEQTIASARRALADASPRRLDACLEPWLAPASHADQHPRSAVEINVLLAVAEMRRDREAAAVQHIERAIELAAPSGLWGPLLAYEGDLKSVLERHGWQLGAANPAAVEMLENLRADHTTPMETLTDRERVVLRYLPTLMSNSEIAAEMVVSVNTVKTHLKSIYRKLGVERRRDALLRARQVELL